MKIQKEVYRDFLNDLHDDCKAVIKNYKKSIKKARIYKLYDLVSCIKKLKKKAKRLKRKISILEHDFNKTVKKKSKHKNIDVSRKKLKKIHNVVCKLQRDNNSYSSSLYNNKKDVSLVSLNKDDIEKKDKEQQKLMERTGYEYLIEFANKSSSELTEISNILYKILYL